MISKKYINSFGVITVFLILFGSAAFAQPSTCVRDKETGRMICNISEPDPYPVGPVGVPNASKVVLRVSKINPFTACTVGEIKLTDIKEPDPIKKILDLFTKALTGVPNLGLTTKQVNPVSKPLNLSLAEELLWESKNQHNANADGLNTAMRLKGDLKSLTEEIEEFVSQPPVGEAQFNATGNALLGRIVQVIRDDQAFNKELDLNARNNRLGSLIAMLPSIKNDPLAFEIRQNVSGLLGQIAELKFTYEKISEAMTEFKGVRKILIIRVDKEIFNDAQASNRPFALLPFKEDLSSLLPYSQKTAETTVTCKNLFTGDETASKIPIAVNYQNDSPLSVSVGPLFSTIKKQKLGTFPVSGLPDATTGAPTFKNEFGVVDESSFQVIPFAFLNYRIKYFGDDSNPADLPPWSLHISGGVGINPNSGTNEPEFFFGPSLAYKNRYFFQFGDHIGRFQKGFKGGFNIGDPVPASFPGALIDKKYKHGFGFAISYKLPL